MLDIRIHSRGPQGLINLAELLTLATQLECRRSEASVIDAGRGKCAPVTTLCKIESAAEIMPHANPFAVVVEDATLFADAEVLGELHPESLVLINSCQRVDELGESATLARMQNLVCVCVPANELGLQFTGRPQPHSALLGAFAALTGTLRLETVEQMFTRAFPGKLGKKHAAAAAAGYESVAREIAGHLVHEAAD